MKEKKKQKLLKAGYDARERARKEKEREREAREAEERREEEERERDLEGWASKLRAEHEVVFIGCRSVLVVDSMSAGYHEQNKGAGSTAGRAERSKECCCSGKNEEYCQPGCR